MMKANAVAAAALFAIACAPAWAINKCTGRDGKVTFQDIPCAVDTTGRSVDAAPASGRAPQPRPAAEKFNGAGASSNTARTEAQRIEAAIAKSQAFRRRVDLESLLVPRAQTALYQLRAGCDAQINALRQKKSRANNNLAGATWEASLSQEMQAVATRCDTQQREQKEEFETLRTECVHLGGCKDL